MASLNKVTIIGYLGNEPEMRTMSNGEAVANISVATSETWTDKTSGERREATEWHRIIFYRRQAEVIGQYLHKGSQVYIEGRLKTRKWQDQSGQDRYTTEIQGDKLIMLGDSRPTNATQATPTGQNMPAEPIQAGDNFDDDIPFAPIGLGWSKTAIHAI